MASLRLRYEHGQFVPLEPVQDIHEGDELEIQWKPLRQPSPDEINQMLDQTAGLWADVDGIEQIFDEQRAIWDEEWRNWLA